MVTRYTQPSYQVPTIMEPGTALGYLIGQALAGNAERSRVKGLTDYIANQSQSFTGPAQVTDADTQAAQQAYAKQKGFDGLMGKDGFQSLADQQQQWKSLDAQRQQLLAKGDTLTTDDKGLLDNIAGQQDILHRNAEAVRAILKHRGIDTTGFGAGDDAQASLLDRLGALQQTQTPAQTSAINGLSDFIGSQQKDIPNSRKGQPLPTVGFGHATVESDPSTGQITVNRTSLLPPATKITTDDIVKAAQQPNATLTFADLAGTNANDPAIAALAKQIAQNRADAGFQPATFLTEVQRKAASAGLNDEDYNRVMAQATGLASAKADQIKQAKNQALIQNLVQQLQGTGNNTGAALVQYLVANGVKAGDLAAHFPNAEYVSVDTGGTTYRMPKQGIGFGRTVGLQNTVKPDTMFNGNVSMVNNQNTNATSERNNLRTNETSAANNIRTNTTSANNNIRSNNTTLAGKQMDLRDKDKSLEAAKIVLKNYNDFESTRLGAKDTRPNPYADSAAAAQQIVNSKMGVVDNATLKLQSAINNVYQSNGGDRTATLQWIDDHAAEIQNAGLDVGLAKSWVS